MNETASTQKPRILGLVGATASGKTALSLEIAGALGGEIVCLDSMQIYRRMEIGTAKPTAEERAAVPHHMLDIVEPTASYSVAQYTEQARQVIADVISRGKVPLLVGGTGLYLQGLSHPMDYGGQPSDPAVRAELQGELARTGPAEMHERLRQVDPEAAGRLHPNDTRRVIRALEIYRLTGVPMSRHRAEEAAASPYDFLLYAIDWPRAELHRRINLRVDQMMRDGLMEEVWGLLRSGVTPDMQSMQGLGYKELIPTVQGQISPEAAVEQIKTGTRNYARRQLIWFRRDKRIRWIESSQIKNASKTMIQTWEEPETWISAH